jgi:molybdopterin converting factor subunit 1
MQIRVKFFAILRDLAGVPEASLDLPDNSSISIAAQHLAERFPPIQQHLPRVAYALNRTYVKPDAQLHDGDELALIPPVSGG